MMPTIAVLSLELGAGNRGEMLQSSLSFQVGLFLCILPNFRLWGVGALGSILHTHSAVIHFCFHCALEGELFRGRCAPHWSWYCGLLPLALVAMQHNTTMHSLSLQSFSKLPMLKNNYSLQTPSCRFLICHLSL